MDISIAFMPSIANQRQEKWLTAATGGKNESSLSLSWVSTAYMVSILY
jgi:hypothetical protein